MLVSVDFSSLAAFEAVQPADDLAVISIGDPGDGAPPALVRFQRALRLSFLDIEPCDVGFADAPGLFTPSQALEAARFVQELHESELNLRLVTHCLMGASRSAAVALMANALTGCAFPRQPDAHYANPHVARVTAEVTGRAIEIPPFFFEGKPDGPHEYLPAHLVI